MSNPIATYRIQFHKGFTFTDFEKVIPYLHQFGVITIYASPVFTSMPGSTHGYDGINPHQINPEIGTEEQLRTISLKLKNLGMKWLQDIVPNHMAFDTQNLWLNDVLEKGARSAFATYFDTALVGSFFEGKLMVPFLGASQEESIGSKKLQIEFTGSTFGLKHSAHIFPLNPKSYADILFLSPGNVDDSFRLISTQLEDLEMLDDALAYQLRFQEIKTQLAALMRTDDFSRIISQNLAQINGNQTLLNDICRLQHYRLCASDETNSKINYRRFFTVNNLICINIQQQEVFEFYHQKIKQYVVEGIFQGLRIDHIDGLYDPAKYLEQLRALVGKDNYIVVEKILQQHEELPQNWPVNGTTGYDFLALANNIFTNKKGKKAFNQLYQQVRTNQAEEKEQVWQKKSLILHHHMAGELDNLFRFFISLNLADEKEIKKVGEENLKDAIAAILVFFPVYRFYNNVFPLENVDYQQLKSVFDIIGRQKNNFGKARHLLEKVLLHPAKKNDESVNKNVLAFYQRLMQFTGPLMAKGVEDTLMYTYNRLISHNEVGDAPGAFGISAKKFHQKMIARKQNWPETINTTATHDTKRGEDARARLNVLTDVADDWAQKITLWRQLNTAFIIDNQPDTNDEYFIYETLLATYPMPGTEDNYLARLQEYLQKAFREAKRNTSWQHENEAYEQAVAVFIGQILDPEHAFLADFKSFHQKITDFGIVNSMAQLLLKLTAPGVPDIYQGNENWDFSFVDPDNRRPVNFAENQSLFTGSSDVAPAILWANRYDGSIKIQLLRKVLNERKNESQIFISGDYIPLKIKGKYKKNILAFLRRQDNCWFMSVIPLHLAGLCKEQNAEITAIDWADTKIMLPKEAPGIWENLLANSSGDIRQKAINLQDILHDLPYAFLRLRQNNNRKAGILMHITSLPSAFGTGDLGPEAFTFADALYKSKQRYWQILPLGPVSAQQQYSPYSPLSSMAGNTLLISLEEMFAEGLLGQTILKDFAQPATACADFEAAERIRKILFTEAYQNFNHGDFEQLKQDFTTFCAAEAFWLDDYALFIALKTAFESHCWYEWPEQLKKRQLKALAAFTKLHAAEIEQEKFLQFIFARQWQKLKDYCHKKCIEIIGDLPFYISYDSADVWANPTLFAIDKNSSRVMVAGVPPDYFNAEGQLWGMPVYRWDVLKKTGYDWWIRRIRKNLALFDVIRIDHFRAFASYWQVSASEITAINGEWKNGPGADFFNILVGEFGELPFLAEDLGEINTNVYVLRDQFELPGMKVLQFAFGDDMPKSMHIPHNYPQNCFVYTGTHDNNTVVGWFDDEADHHTKKRLKKYFHQKLKSENIAWKLIETAYSSVAKTAIIPIQDILELDNHARMNTPAAKAKNWLWRMLPGDFDKNLHKKLRKLTEFYGRAR